MSYKTKKRLYDKIAWLISADSQPLTHGLMLALEQPRRTSRKCLQCVQVQRDFEELPQGAAASLRDSLVELLLRFGNGSPPVRTQLCLAVAALVAHMPPQQWGPGGSLQWLVQRLSSDSQAAALPCLLELLTILPQVHAITDTVYHCITSHHEGICP